MNDERTPCNCASKSFELHLKINPGLINKTTFEKVLMHEIKVRKVIEYQIKAKNTRILKSYV